MSTRQASPRRVSEDTAPSPVERPALSGLFPDEIARLLDLKSYQGRQVFKWIHQKSVFDFDKMTDLSKELRQRLARQAVACRAKPVATSSSAGTGTRKQLLAMPDGETVEAVFIPAKERFTLCLSTQAGCAVKCPFCATGQSGFARNLTPAEVVEQALYLLRDARPGDRTPNIVFMGMGEPFRNYDATVKSVRLLMETDGLGIGARRITVSTAGEVDGIRRFADEDWQVRLSISLHAANDTLRDRLVPLNRRYNLADLMRAAAYYYDRTGRQVTFEWALLEAVNDSDRDVDELARLLSGFKASVNLIPYNPVPDTGYRQPSRAACERFRDGLIRRGINATLRLERGQDINAACGQLRRGRSYSG